MDAFQLSHEAQVGLRFIAWYNDKHRTQFTYTGRSEEAPHLIFKDGVKQIWAEVATVYYDSTASQFRWLGTSGNSEPPRDLNSVEFHAGLVRFINQGVSDRCGKDYLTDCVLLISVMPTVTTISRMRELLKDLVIPERNPFKGIYLLGRFTRAGRSGRPEIEVRQVA